MFNHTHKPFQFFKMIPWIIIGIGGFIGLAFLFGIIVMLLWNWLMPALFGLPELGYWQAWGLLVLAQILFKGPLHHNQRSQHHDFNREDRDWKQKFREKFRENFREKSREDCMDGKEEEGKEEKGKGEHDDNDN